MGVALLCNELPEQFARDNARSRQRATKRRSHTRPAALPKGEKVGAETPLRLIDLN
ncbi:MAG: hypothetical protein RLZ67_182 [Actinomycetota bacterium]|jgi:hypothetical protein